MPLRAPPNRLADQCIRRATGYADRMRLPAAPVGIPLAAALGRLAALRGGEAVHHRGVVLAGSLTIRPRGGPTGAPLLDRAGSYGLVARLSWGLAGGWPLDMPGLGLRVLDADGAGGVQDLLVDGCRPAPHDRVPRLRADLAGWFSTLLRLRLAGPDGPKVQVAFRLDPPPGGGRLGLREASAGGLTGLLVVHDRGRLLATGRAVLPEPGPAGPGDPGRPRFDLDADAGGLVSVGFFAELRRRTYAASRAGDPRPGTTRSAAAPTG